MVEYLHTCASMMSFANIFLAWNWGAKGGFFYERYGLPVFGLGILSTA